MLRVMTDARLECNSPMMINAMRAQGLHLSQLSTSSAAHQNMGRVGLSFAEPPFYDEPADFLGHELKL